MRVRKMGGGGWGCISNITYKKNLWINNYFIIFQFFSAWTFQSPALYHPGNAYCVQTPLCCTFTTDSRLHCSPHLCEKKFFPPILCNFFKISPKHNETLKHLAYKSFEFYYFSRTCSSIRTWHLERKSILKEKQSRQLNRFFHVHTWRTKSLPCEVDRLDNKTYCLDNQTFNPDSEFDSLERYMTRQDV